MGDTGVDIAVVDVAVDESKVTLALRSILDPSHLVALAVAPGEDARAIARAANEPALVDVAVRPRDATLPGVAGNAGRAKELAGEAGGAGGELGRHRFNHRIRVGGRHIPVTRAAFLTAGGEGKQLGLRLRVHAALGRIVANDGLDFCVTAGAYQ